MYTVQCTKKCTLYILRCVLYAKNVHFMLCIVLIPTQTESISSELSDSVKEYIQQIAKVRISVTGFYMYLLFMSQFFVKVFILFTWSRAKAVSSWL